MTLDAPLLAELESATLAHAKKVGLNDLEWEFLVDKLKRKPSMTELQMMGVMWSEHCSYKASKRFLKKLPTQSAEVLQGPGENAGVVDLDVKRAIVFKVESHNHPSFVEPFQGAATGVGGILRDIFTMGARPIALGDYLRFGDFKSSKHRSLLKGVVSGIAHYGNCVGIPTVAGQVRSDDSYQGNILVNVFALGLVDKDKIYLSAGATPGHSVMIWGAKTGRDGVHGASLLASADFGDNADSREQKIRVQVGDPFKEKCLMEATLACMQDLKEDLIAIQDMGAAGITCSTMEITAKSEGGMRVDLDKVPQREKNMAAYEILLSESQERMLAVVRKGSEEKFIKHLQKWGCEAVTIGETTKQRQLEIYFHGHKVVDLPVQDLIDPPPFSLPEPQPLESVEVLSEVPEDITSEWPCLQSLMASPDIASKAPIFGQYDSTVGVSTVVGSSQDAAVLWVGDHANPHMGIVFKGAAYERVSRKFPRQGAILSMARTVRSLACVGARAMAFTDGVNMGNPMRGETVWTLSEMMEGLRESSLAFKMPCIGGNVSLYNQTTIGNERFDIDPTIFVIAVGKMLDVRKATPGVFQRPGSEVWLLDAGSPSQELPFGSLYAKMFWNKETAFAEAPAISIESELKLQAAMLEASETSLCLSARSIGSGGLAATLVKSCFAENKIFGFDGDCTKWPMRRDQLLFGENGGRVIVEIETKKRAELMKLGLKYKLELKRLGTVQEEATFRIRPLMSGDLELLHRIWMGTYQSL